MTVRRAKPAVHSVTLVVALATALACAGSKDTTPVAPAPEAAADPSSRVTIQSAAKPNRNESSAEPGQGRGWELMKPVNDCDAAVCSGVAPDPLIEAIREHATQARSCYEAALKQMPTLAGRMSLQLRIRHDGAACPLRVLRDELGDNPALLPCVRNLLEVNYPKPQGGCVELVLPLRFVPEFVDAGTASGTI